MKSKSLLDVIKTRLNFIRCEWKKYKKGEQHNFKKELELLFDLLEKPYNDLLLVLEEINDFIKKPLSPSIALSEAVMEHFHEWIKNKMKFKSQLTFEVKEKAFKFISHSLKESILLYAFKIYEYELDSKLLLCNVNFLKSQHLYQQMSWWVVLFKLQDEFGVDDFLLPLTLQKNTGTVIEYLKYSQKDQIKLAIEVDEIYCNIIENKKPNYVVDLYALYGIIVDSNALNSHTVKEILRKIVAEFKIPLEHTPFLQYCVCSQDLNLLMNEWLKNNLSTVGFRERVDILCEECNRLHNPMIDKLIRYNEVEEAIYWIKKLQIQSSYIPDNVTLKSDKRKEDLKDFYMCPEVEKITQFIGNKNKSKLFMYLRKSKSYKHVGYDIEYNSTCSPNPLNSVAIFQLAFPNKVFLIDVISLKEDTQFWIQLCQLVLNNKNVTKLGYGQNDKATFSKHTVLSFIDSSGSDYLDLHKLEMKMKSHPNMHYPYSFDQKENSGLRGLQRLVKSCFGKPLDKRECMSNWERRPLRPEQIKYAALDAFVLIAIFNLMKGILKKLQIYDVHKFYNEIKEENKNSPEIGREVVTKSLFTECVNHSNTTIQSSSQNKELKCKKLKVPKKKRMKHRKSKTGKEKTETNPPLAIVHPFVSNGTQTNSTEVGTQHLCPFCFNLHTTKCSFRKRTFKIILSNTLQIFDLFEKNLLNSIEKFEETLSKKLNNSVDYSFKACDIGKIDILDRKKLCYLTTHFFSRIVIRRKTLVKFKLFTVDVLLYFGTIYEVIKKLIKPWRNRIADRKKVFNHSNSYYDGDCIIFLCEICFERGHSFPTCDINNFLQQLNKCLEKVSNYTAEVINFFVKIETVWKNLADTYNASMNDPTIKPLVIRHYKCSYCFRFGHIDLFCSFQKADINTSLLYLKNTQDVINKCLAYT